MARKIIGEGASTHIWMEPWMARGILLEHFQRSLTFSVECNKQARVEVLIQGGEWHIPDYVRRQIQAITGYIEEFTIGGDEWGGFV